jgi:quercetin dioxygenase-like cupin family protein
MPGIARLRALTHDNLTGIAIYPLETGTQLSAGRPQEVLVEMAPHTTIPLHSHGVDAFMFIAGGSGTVLSDDEDLNGYYVERGHLVHFEAGVHHGFQAAGEGLIFVSKNGGIVAETGSGWDIQFKLEDPG